MKNLKKFVALLLAGVMAMVMLTACGGGAASETSLEDNIRKALGNNPNAVNLRDQE